MAFDDGGPAFPSPGVGEFGMSLRDHYAGQQYAARLQADAIIVTTSFNTLCKTKNKAAIKSILGVMEMAARNNNPQKRAELSYKDADALIVEKRYTAPQQGGGQ